MIRLGRTFFRRPRESGGPGPRVLAPAVSGHLRPQSTPHDKVSAINGSPHPEEAGTTVSKGDGGGNRHFSAPRQADLLHAAAVAWTQRARPLLPHIEGLVPIIGIPARRQEPTPALGASPRPRDDRPLKRQHLRSSCADLFRASVSS